MSDYPQIDAAYRALAKAVVEAIDADPNTLEGEALEKLKSAMTRGSRPCFLVVTHQPRVIAEARAKEASSSSERMAAGRARVRANEEKRLAEYIDRLRAYAEGGDA